jgi:membrane protein implicated in regulation of membrane protease activity
MLIYLYLFALILGGVLVLASILLGGHGETDADADAGAGLDKDLPVLEGQAGDISGVDVFWAFRSIRFWTFFLAFFGMTGLVLDGLGLVGSSIVAAILATGMGAASGFVAAGLMRWLGRDESGHIASSSDYVGKTVRVLLPVGRDQVGKVRLELRGASVDVLATTDEEGPITSEEEAIIIEMDGPRARIARLER